MPPQPGMSPRRTSGSPISVPGSSPAMMAFGVAYTLASAAAGGFVAALIARRHEVLHALVLGTMGALATLFILVAAPSSQRSAEIGRAHV